MTEAQGMAYLPALLLMVAMTIGFLLISARISDLNKRIDDLRADTFSRIERLENQYSRLESILVGKLGELEARLGRIEGHLGAA